MGLTRPSARTKTSDNIIVIVQHDDWKGLVPTVKRAIEAALIRQKAMKVALTVLLTNDAEVKALNAQYRGKRKPTNVLSFPDGEVVNGITQLGDIAMAYETMAREAEEQGKKLKDHITHLVIHGVLHLLGYDHEQDVQAKVMEALEIKLLARMGIANPYESD